MTLGCCETGVGLGYVVGCCGMGLGLSCTDRRVTVGCLEAGAAFGSGET